MAGNKSLEMAGNMFSYENQRCDCKVTTNYTEDGKEYHSLQIKNIDGFYKYAYASLDGLVMINSKTGAIIETYKVIEDFLNIKMQDATSIKKFVDNYGFFMPLPDDGKYRLFDHVELGCLLLRFRYLVQLMALIEDDTIDYDKILRHVFNLLFSQPRKIAINNNDSGIQSCIHEFTNLWYQIDTLHDLSSNLICCQTNDPYDDYYPIPDLFTKNEEKLGYIDYHEIVETLDDYEYSSSSLFKAKVYKLYRDAFSDSVTEHSRLVIDFLFHLLKMGIKIDDIPPSGKLTISENINNMDKFDEDFKSTLIQIAKSVIKDEFDYALYGIHPTYDIETMSPNWEIPNLYTALYFALFYTRPEYEVYRKCANPNCNRLFKVKTTNSRKQYHNTACQNAAAQMRHRKLGK